MTNKKLPVVLLAFFIIVGVGLFVFGLLRPETPVFTVDASTKLPLTEQRASFIQQNLLSGGPEKDGIPALQDKSLRYEKISESQLDPNTIIFGVRYKNIIAAYPREMMFWHEIVNEVTSDGEKISVTYCPLTQSVIGFKGYNLGVSGMLFNSNLVLYDRESDAYMPQIESTFIDKSLLGIHPETFEVFITTLGEWKNTHPDSLVLTKDTGFNRNYSINPYQDYYDNLYRVWFPLEHENDSLPPKEMVFSIQHNGESVSFVKQTFREKYPDGADVSLGGEKVNVFWDDDLGVVTTNQSDWTQFESFWFAVYAFYPDTKLY